MSNENQVVVSTTEQLRQAIAAGYKLQQIFVSQSDKQAIAAAREEGVREGLSRAAAAGAEQLGEDAKRWIAKQERDRISAIREVAQPGFDKLVARAIDESMSPERFALEMMREQNDRGVTLHAIRRDAPPPAPRANPPANDAKRSVIDPAAIYAARKAKEGDE